MRGFLRHLARSLLYLARRPWTWIVLPVAMLWSTLQDPVMLRDWLRVGHGGLGQALENTALLSICLLWCPLLAWILPSATRASASGGEGWPMPALPVSARVRAVAEVTAVLILLHAIRTLHATSLYVLVYRRWLHAWDDWCSVAGLALRHAAALDLLTIALGFPLIAAWLGSGRRGIGYWVRILGTHTTLFVALAVAMLTGHLWAVLPGHHWLSLVALLSYAAALAPVPLLLSVAVVYSIGREPSWNLAAVWRFSSRPLHRAPLEPERRLRADILSRSVPVLGLTLVPALVTAPVFARGITKPDEDPGKAFALLMFGFLVIAVAWFAVAIATLFPLGVPLLSSPQELFAGRYCAAWSCLPVRPEAIRCLVFGHALTVPLVLGVGAVLARALVWASTGRAHALLAFAWLPGRHATATWAFLATCWAGLALCIAVGDRARGILAMLGIGLSLWWGAGSERGATAALLIGSLFAVLPLVHLRRPRQMA